MEPLGIKGKQPLKTKPNYLLKTKSETRYSSLLSETQKSKRSPSPKIKIQNLDEKEERDQSCHSHAISDSLTHGHRFIRPTQLQPYYYYRKNPKQTLDDDTTITTVMPTRSPRRRRRERTNRSGFRLAFCNHHRFRCEVRWGFEEHCSRCL